MRIGRQNGVKGIRYQEVCVLRIGLTHVYHWMYLHYLLLFAIHVLVLDRLGDPLMYLSLSVIRCISVEPRYVYQTVGVWIGEWHPN